MLPFKDQGLRPVCNFAGFASVEVRKERSVMLFKIPLWMALEGVAAPSVEGSAAAWAGCSVGARARECFQPGQDYSEYSVNMYM